MDGIVIRWGISEDIGGIARILALNSMSTWYAFEERFIVAEERGEIKAVARYRTTGEGLLLCEPVVDPWAGERRFAVALYEGAGELAREMGLREVRTQVREHREYPSGAGYRRRAGGWRLDLTRRLDRRRRFPGCGWRRALSLLRGAYVPFFRLFCI